MQLRLHSLTKNYNGKCAVNQVNLDFTSGIYGLIGPNGAGKTTLIKMMVGILPPTSGKVTLDNIPIRDLDEKYRDILGYMPQEIGYYRNFTAKRFLKYIAALKGIPHSKMDTKINQLMEIVGLADVGKKKLGAYSGGMIRRIGIVQALLNDPKILILDEPTAGLDPKERIRFRNILAKLAADRIVVLSTHIVSDVESIAEKVILLKSGDVIGSAPTDHFLQSVANKVWTTNIKHEDLDNFKNKFAISNMIPKNGSLEIRVVGDERPDAQSIAVTPRLEDVYVYHFAEQEVFL